ncbi:L-aspartate oxidase [Synechococcus sp. RSCCF101]|uniref:L-aspartate oxidase n=1 Tax=Synechococcus sp. RSCCF101 TaxID=2511069 RepID=UPI00351A1F63
MSCLELPQGLRVLLLNKDAGPRSSSRWAQGGIAAVTRPEDSLASHRDDTFRAGAGLCDPSAVELLVREAPGCVQRLLALGMEFDRSGTGLSTTLEAAHSHHRVLHVQDRTGKALVQALAERVRARPLLTRGNGVLALRLWQDGGCCRGLLVLEGERLRWLSARAVVLATGGGAHLFANSTNPPSSSGDGIAMAHQLGAGISDLEFVQFHPTALMVPGAPHFLISEAVRGEGGRLRHPDGTSPVASLPGGDLAPRDQVSRALVRAIRRSERLAIGLDLGGIEDDRLQRRFPTILRRCREYGVDPTRQPIPVAPAAHYWMGGVRTDLRAATSVPGLYAVGEVACTGVHGANRLASNSLMECLVFARALRRIDLLPAAAPPWQARQEQCDAGTLQLHPGDWEAPEQVLNRIEDLRQLCWQVAGVERSGRDLQRALPRLARLQEQWNARPLPALVAALPVGRDVALPADVAVSLAVSVDYSHRLTVSRLLLEACAFRAESRGGHFREDAPGTQPHWQRHSLQRRGRPISTLAIDPPKVPGPSGTPSIPRSR